MKIPLAPSSLLLPALIAALAGFLAQAKAQNEATIQSAGELRSAVAKSLPFLETRGVQWMARRMSPLGTLAVERRGGLAARVRR